MRKVFASMTAVSMAAAVMLAGCGSNSSDKKTTTAASTKATEAATEKKTEAATQKKPFLKKLPQKKPLLKIPFLSLSQSLPRSSSQLLPQSSSRSLPSFLHSNL